MNKDRPHALLDIHDRILNLVKTGEATTRGELMNLLPASASLVSLRTRELIDAGLIFEGITTPSTGGRPSKKLHYARTQLNLIAADLGTRHARIALADGNASIIAECDLQIDTSLGPQLTLDALADAFTQLIDEHSPQTPLGAICIGLPAPIDHAHSWIDSGSRLPGWHHYPVVDHIQKRFNTTVLVENDANLMALGEHLAHSGLVDSVTVKAGSALGTGLIIGSSIHRGASGAAGDIAHVRMSAFGDMACDCGKSGCLETVVSGRALTQQWQQISGSEATYEDLINASLDANPQAVALMRLAGSRLGEALSTVVGFFNPQAVFISGRLSTISPFLAAVRASLYTGCHPLITRTLTIEAATSGAQAGVLGGLHLCRQSLLEITD
ncbi:ROK family protein [Schaalia vaccimaxillae]|uniref:ROK family protein n=1 Tax=Schaalia vaccimaxillae TaxID=183916 RepID=UPI0003B34FCE|nr:ROK family protein [Schaalia vaccimaxillae]